MREEWYARGLAFMKHEIGRIKQRTRKGKEKLKKRRRSEPKIRKHEKRKRCKTQRNKAKCDIENGQSLNEVRE
jgi:hypothetical protein